MGVFSASSFSLFASHATTSNHFEPARSANTLDRLCTAPAPPSAPTNTGVSHFLLSGLRVCQRYVGVEYFRACVRMCVCLCECPCCPWPPPARDTIINLQLLLIARNFHTSVASVSLFCSSLIPIRHLCQLLFHLLKYSTLIAQMFG